MCDRSDSGYLAISRLDVCGSRWVSMCLPQARHIEKLCMFYVDRGLQDNGSTDVEAQRLLSSNALENKSSRTLLLSNPVLARQYISGNPISDEGRVTHYAKVSLRLMLVRFHIRSYIYRLRL